MGFYPGWRDSVDATHKIVKDLFVESIGNDGDRRTFLAAFDQANHVVALEDRYGESGQVLVLGSIAAAPPVFPRHRVVVQIRDGLTAGSQQAEVEKAYGYDGRAVKRVLRCGLTAERFQSPQEGASREFVFVFKSGKFFAFSTSGGA
jgi:hypothetical protein